MVSIKYNRKTQIEKEKKGIHARTHRERERERGQLNELRGISNSNESSILVQIEHKGVSLPQY